MNQPGIPQQPRGNNENWRLPTPQTNIETTELSAQDPTFLVDTDVSSVFDITEFGLEKDDIAGFTNEIVSVVSIGEDNSRRIPILKQTSKNSGIESFIILSEPDDIGARAVHSLSYSQPAIIGRNPGLAVTEDSRAVGISTSELGIEGDYLISRNHFSVTLTKAGIEIQNNGQNGTTIEAVRKREHSEAVLGKGVTTLTGGTIERVDEELRPKTLITEVPKEVSPQRESSAEVQQTPNFAETSETLDREKKDLVAGLSEDDQMNLWRYASGTLNKSEAQRQGNGQESINQSQIAGQALRALSPKAKERADAYLSVFRRQQNKS